MPIVPKPEISFDSDNNIILTFSETLDTITKDDVSIIITGSNNEGY